MSAADRSRVAVYHGRELAGHVMQEGSKHRATSWPAGTALGIFPTRQAACDAVSGAAGYPRGGPSGAHTAASIA
jgi:hypothetical protein